MSGRQSEKIPSGHVFGTDIFPGGRTPFFRCCLTFSYIIFEQHAVINGVAVKTPQFLTSHCLSTLVLAVGVICGCGLSVCAPGSVNNFHARGLQFGLQGFPNRLFGRLPRSNQSICYNAVLLLICSVLLV